MQVTVKGNHEVDYKNVIRNNPDQPSNTFVENIDLFQTEVWISKHEEEYQPALEDLVSKITRISFKEFKSGLREALKDLNTRLEIKTPEEYEAFLQRTVVLVENGKSNQWVAELAQAYFKFLPDSYYRLGNKDAREFAAHIADHANPEEVKYFAGTNIVLFDDGSYSGQQITDHVATLLKMKKTLKFSKIITVIPFSTIHARERLFQTVQKMNMVSDIVITESRRIPTVAESVSEDHAKKLTKLWWSKEKPQEGPHSRGVIWFDHKIPNGQSFIEAIEKGNVVNLKTPIKNTFQLLPSITVPYK